MNNGYTSYKAHELAADNSFIHFARMTDAAAVKQWTHWLEQHPEKREEVELAIKIVRSLRFKEKEFTDKDQLWKRIDTTIQKSRHEQSKSILQLRVIWRWAAAAAVLIIAGVYYFLSSQPTTIVTLPGQSLVYTLPDRSVIRMNAGSTIQFQKNTFKKDRTINLSGEAFFEVEKGPDFRVISALGEVKVLGTSFNVYARKQKMEVNCYTGKVMVRSTQGQSTILSSGQQAIIRHQVLQGAEFDPAAADWRGGVFYYQSEDVGQVFDEISRQFEVSISCPQEVSRRSFTGFFSKSNLDSALYTVCWPLNLDYSIQDKHVEIIPR